MGGITNALILVAALALTGGGVWLALMAFRERRREAEDGMPYAEIGRAAVQARIVALAREAQQPVPPAPPSAPVRLPAAVDPPEEIIAPDADGIDEWIGHTIMIEYCDAQGAETRRRVTIRAVATGADGTTMLRCWCHEREDWRHFRLDRITAVIDPRTGEIFDDPAAFFEREIEAPSVAAAPRRPRSSAAGAREALKPIRHELVILAFLARADGRFRDVEKQVAADHAIARCPAIAGERQWLVGHIGRMAPTLADFEQAAAALDFNDAAPLTGLIEALTRLAVADSDISSVENHILQAFMDLAQGRGASPEV